MLCAPTAISRGRVIELFSSARGNTIFQRNHEEDVSGYINKVGLVSEMF